MKQVFAIAGWLFFSYAHLCAQPGQIFTSNVYNVNYAIDVPLAVTSLTANFVGLRKTQKKPFIDSVKVINFDRQDVLAIDRSATYVGPEGIEQAEDISDLIMNATFLAPALLMLDKDIRRDWVPILVLYLETEGITGSLYSWGSVLHIDRPRPLAYNPDFPLETRLYGNKPNSFYSGHVASSAAATFFMAKVYTDYHPELGKKKWWLFGAAAVPPIVIGYFRYRAARHYFTDIVAGLGVGITTGLLIPHIHKKKERKLTVLPVFDAFHGGTLTLRF